MKLLIKLSPTRLSLFIDLREMSRSGKKERRSSLLKLFLSW
jgi:hypothetical protein